MNSVDLWYRILPHVINMLSALVAAFLTILFLIKRNPSKVYSDVPIKRLFLFPENGILFLLLGSMFMFRLEHTSGTDYLDFLYNGITFLIILVYVYQGNRVINLESVFSALTAALLYAIGEASSSFLLFLIDNSVYRSEWKDSIMDQFMLCIMACLFILYLSNLLLEGFKKEHRHGDLVFLLLIPILTITSLWTLFLIFHDSWTQTGIVSFVVIVCSIITVNLISYGFYEALRKEHILEMQYALAVQQKEYISLNQVELENYYTEARSMHHDFKHHMVALQAYMNEENLEGAKSYISSFLSKKLGTIMPNVVYCDEQTINYMLNRTISRCNSKYIDCSILVSVPMKERIHVMDVCLVFNLLLDNAIEASVKEKEEDRHIWIEIHGDDCYCQLKVSNQITDSVLKDNRHLQTSKADSDKHGFGIRNTRQIMEQNQGTIDIYEEYGRFVAYVQFPWRLDHEIE